MRHEDERRGRRGSRRWEPAEDGEGRRWHDDDERHGHGRRGHGHFPGPFAGQGFPGSDHGRGSPAACAVRARAGAMFALRRWRC